MSFKTRFDKGYKSGNQSVSFFWLLGLLFIGLKLTNYIAWSWWLVLLPFYGIWVIILATLLIAGMFAIIASLL